MKNICSTFNNLLLGKNVTEEYYKVTPRLNHAMEEAVKVAERKDKNNEVILSVV